MSRKAHGRHLLQESHHCLLYIAITSSSTVLANLGCRSEAYFSMVLHHRTYNSATWSLLRVFLTGLSLHWVCLLLSRDSLYPSEASSGVLCPALGSSVHERVNNQRVQERAREMIKRIEHLCYEERLRIWGCLPWRREG